MTTRRGFLVLLILLLVPGAMASVSVDYDKEKAFADYKTFGWKPGSPARSQLNQERLEASIRAELESHGMTQSDG